MSVRRRVRPGDARPEDAFEPPPVGVGPYPHGDRAAQDAWRQRMYAWAAAKGIDDITVSTLIPDEPWDEQWI